MARQRQWVYGYGTAAWNDSSPSTLVTFPLTTVSPGETIGRVFVTTWLIVQQTGDTLPSIQFDGSVGVRISGFGDNPRNPELNTQAWLLWHRQAVWSERMQTSPLGSGAIVNRAIDKWEGAGEGQRRNDDIIDHDFIIAVAIPSLPPSGLNVFYEWTVRALKFTGPP